MQVEDSKQGEGIDAWSRAELRIWCVGGWRFQLRGGEVHDLDGPAAEEALARHLAVHHSYGLSSDALRKLLSRNRNRPISRQSLHVAVNRLRDLLATAAGGGQDTTKLAKRLVPHAKAATAADGSRVSQYRFGPGVWLDLRDAPNPLAFHPLAVDRDESVLGGGARARVFAGSERLALEASSRLEETRHLTGNGLPSHLAGFTPPIRRLLDLVPVALDRLHPWSMLVIQGKGESGRLHLAEAIELGTLAWRGKPAEQIREQPDTGPRADSDPEDVLPGHLYILDLTRELTAPQRERLLAVRKQAGKAEHPEERPSLLVVTDGAKVEPRGGLAGWERAETISLPPPSAKDVEEAYLIATRELPGDCGKRRAEFETLATEYAREHNSEIGLRAASSAASIAVEGGGVPHAGELPPPDTKDLPLDELRGEERKLARALAWFGNDPFTLADAKAATERPDLPRSEIFRIATTIPGGGAGSYEVHPRLLDASPAPEVPTRICEYLLEKGHEEALEHWPLRAMRILDARSVDIELRLRLARQLIELSRDLGFAENLQRRMRTLLERTQKPDEPVTMEVAIGRGRLLTHLGRLKQAEKVLEPLTRGKHRDKEHKRLRAEAHLRLAIVASQRGNRQMANERARKAARLAPEQLGERVARYYGWEALYTARFESALREFENALRKEQKPENRADAIIGKALALLRLGRLADADGLLADLDMTKLRRITRNRVIRAKATARFLRGDPQGGIEILDKALRQDETRASLESADLLEARAYLHAKLGANSLAQAEQDLVRAEKLLTTEDEWQKAVIYYIRGLIAEAAMRTTPHSTKRLRAEATENAEKSVEAAHANPWHQARAHTLLGRLEVDDGGEDGGRLAKHLRAAGEAHRKLDELWPDALRETLELGATAAGAWRMRDERRRLEALVAALAPLDAPVDPGKEEALAILDEVASAVEGRTRPEVSEGKDETNIRALGQLGEVLLRGGKEALARGKPLALCLLQPRSTSDLEAGVYDFDPSTGDLTPAQGLSGKATSMLKGTANRRFAEQRLAAVLLVGTPTGDADIADPLFLGQWLELFRAETRKRGIGAIESIPIEPHAVDALGLRASAGFVALGMVELPTLD
ncbi:MAG TPA: tetratricopeptide repeat protein [Solirubrobacterales bacterium]|nr:tetratricopeptide repeat protein [Solirubrobacterales bacterium]